MSKRRKRQPKLIPDALGTLWTPFGLSWAQLGRSWPRLGLPLGTLGHPCRYFHRPCATLDTAGLTFESSGAPLRHPLDTPWTPLLPSWEHVLKNVQTPLRSTTFLPLLKKGAHAIRSCLCSPNTHSGILSDTRFQTSKNEKGFFTS